LKRLDVYKPKPSVSPTPFCIVQSEHIYNLPTIVAVPLLNVCSFRAHPKLNPIISINGKDYLFAANEIGAVSKNDCVEYLGNLSDYQYEILNAIDFIFQGF
jgi:toxin CcdB